MTRIDGTIIMGDTLRELRKYHGARVITVDGEQLLEVPYNIGFNERYTYGRIGDVVYTGNYGNSGVCIPKELCEEFTHGWMHNDWSNRTEPFVEYYEEFAKQHADKLIQMPSKVKAENFILRHWFIFSIVSALAIVSLLILFEKFWTTYCI